MIEYSVWLNGGSFEGNKIKEIIDEIADSCTVPGYEYIPNVQWVEVKEREFDDQSDYVELLQRKIDNQIENINNE